MQQFLLADVAVHSRDFVTGDVNGLPLDAPLQSKPWFLVHLLVHLDEDRVIGQDT